MMRVGNLSLARAGRLLWSVLSFEVLSGEVTVVLGPNGAGKSSLLLALAGLLPAEGSIALAGRPLTEWSRHDLARRIVWAGELPPSEFGLTVRQRLALAAEGGGIEAAADALELSALLDRPLGNLSSGERQRVELAAVRLRDCPLWLLDEPAAHLDLRHQIQCLSLMRAAKAEGRAVVTVLHDLAQAQAVADRVILLDGMGGAASGAASELMRLERLQPLYGAPMVSRDGLLLPEYGGER